MPGPSDPRRDEDAAWREIVDNYGERPVIEESVRPDEPQEPRFPSVASRPEPTPELAPDPPWPGRRDPAEDHYVPPPPPPVPKAEPARLLAWIGVIGVPIGVLVDVMARLPLPSWLGLIVMVWFVGGFVYLVASMRQEPRDDDDDGAVV